MASNSNQTTQLEEEQEDLFELVGVFQNKIVGIQYYPGEVNKNEVVILEREPNNSYDRWAVRVDNVRNEKVGHLPRTVVQCLSPLMDSGVLELEALVPFGNQNVYTMPVYLYAYALPENFRRVQAALANAQCKPVQQARNSFYVGGSSASSSQQQGRKTGPKLTIKQAAESVDRLFQDLIKRESTRESCEPSEQILSPLYPHQKEALAWMISKENSNALPPFWEPALSKDGNSLRYVHALTQFISQRRPAPLRGGVLADDMGLGKTLEIIALIATNKPGAAHPAMTVELNDDEGGDEPKSKRQKSTKDSTTEPNPKTKAGQAAILARQLAQQQESPPTPPAADGPKGTLVLCPLSVLSGWQMQIEEHTAGGLSVYVYHGADRNKNVNFLKEFDVVLTTYATMASEAGSKNGVTKVPWLRIVADEAHMLKRASTKTAKAVRALKSDRFWAVTGTPIQNSLLDLHGLLSFLRVEQLSDAGIFKRVIDRPLKQGEEGAVQRLQALVGAITLRRTKDMQRNGRKLVELPPKTVHMVAVELGKDARTKYERWEEAARRIVRHQIAENTLMTNFTAILEVILRLRQICCDPELVPGEDPSFTIENNPITHLNPETVKALEQVLKCALDSADECPICLSELNDPCITTCKHCFCRLCIEAVIARDKPTCPLCRSDIATNKLVQLPEEVPAELSLTATEGGAVGELVGDDNDNFGFSAKVHALLQNINEGASGSSHRVRHVVFSQFTTYLDKIQAALVAQGITFCRLDGKTSAARRAEVLRSFSAAAGDDGPTVMLASLKAGGVGINLTAASHIHIMDPWWNVSVENQAQDRVHRLGQRRPVSVFRYFVESSIEARMLELQEVKRQLMATAFRRTSPEEVRARRLEDVRLLMDL